MGVTPAENAILLGPTGIGQTYLATGLGVQASQSGYSMLFDIAVNYCARLEAAHPAGQLDAELKKMPRHTSICDDEIGCIPFDRDAADLFFQLAPPATSTVPCRSPAI